MHTLGKFDSRKTMLRGPLQMQEDKELVHGNAVDSRELPSKAGADIVCSLEQTKGGLFVQIFHDTNLCRYACTCKRYVRNGGRNARSTWNVVMDFEVLFSIAGVVAMLGWLLLLASPFVPVWSDWLAGLLLPAVLSVGYILLLVVPASGGSGGGFGTLAAVVELFSFEQAALAGWVHFLAFDLLVGASICRTAREEGIRYIFVAPCLPLTFLFGPVGWLAFQTVRLTHKRRVRAR